MHRSECNDSARFVASKSIILLATCIESVYDGRMAHPKSKSGPQISIRSQFARKRASSLAKATGMTITKVIEDALRAYQPAARRVHPGGLIEKGGILVKPKGAAEITQIQINAELDDVRSGER